MKEKINEYTDERKQWQGAKFAKKLSWAVPDFVSTIKGK